MLIREIRVSSFASFRFRRSCQRGEFVLPNEVAIIIQPDNLGEMEGQLPILLIEDDDSDAILFQRAARKNNIGNPIQWVRNGQDAIAYLERSGEYASMATQPKPISIILDLKMPVLNGFEFLEWISQQPQLRKIPILVLSASNFESDRLRALNLGATGYMIKSVNFFELNEIATTIREYWKKHVEPKDSV